MWWHTRRNQIRSSSKTDESNYIGGGVSSVEYWLSCSAGRGRTIVVTPDGLFRAKLKTAGYPLHSPLSPSLLLPCVTVCHQIPFPLYKNGRWYAPDHMCSRRYSPDIHVHMVTWVEHGTHQTYTYPPLTCKNLSHHTTKACMPAENNLSNVCSQEVRACFTFASAANHLSAKCFLTCPKGWKSPSTVVGVTHNLPALPRRDKAGWPYGVQWLPSS